VRVRLGIRLHFPMTVGKMWLKVIGLLGIGYGIHC